jgi:hypothetical protein
MGATGYVNVVVAKLDYYHRCLLSNLDKHLNTFKRISRYYIYILLRDGAFHIFLKTQIVTRADQHYCYQGKYSHKFNIFPLTPSYSTYAFKYLHSCPTLLTKSNSAHFNNLQYSICFIAIVGGSQFNSNSFKCPLMYSIFTF